MKGKANYCEMRDISGTVCTPMAHLAYLGGGAKCSAHLVHTWPFFIAHANRVVIAQ